MPAKSSYGGSGPPDRNTEGAKRPGLFFARRSSEGVDLGTEFDVDQSRLLDDRLPPCSRQGTCDSTGPEVDVSLRAFGHGLFHDDVGDLEATTGLEDPEDLGICPEFVRDEVEDPVGDHHVD